MNRGITVANSPEQIQQGRLAVLLVAEAVGLHPLWMPIGKGAVAIIEIGAGPRDAEPIEPGDSELGFEAFAEAAFRLRVQVNASCDVHMYSSGLRVLRSGRRKSE